MVETQALRRLAAGLRGEWRRVTELRPTVGLRGAITQRVRVNLELDGVIDEIENVVARQSASEHQLAQQAAAIGMDASTGRRFDDDAAAVTESLTARLERLDGRLDGLETRLDSLASLNARVGRLELLQRIRDCEAWIASAPPSDTLISVVLPTRNRAELVTCAIASVQAQTHPHWELLVVDDASSDGTAGVLAAIDDPRVRVLQGAGGGGCAARNMALDVAGGAAIAYVDDDNVMMPGWLAAVAWAFDTNPDEEWLYGARIIERLSDQLPEVYFELFDQSELSRRNMTDTNVLAHRHGLPGARWSPDVRYGGDWELALRLSERRAPLVLPVRAVLYRTSTPDRLSAHVDAVVGYDGMLRRWHSQRLSETLPTESGRDG